MAFTKCFFILSMIVAFSSLSSNGILAACHLLDTTGTPPPPGPALPKIPCLPSPPLPTLPSIPPLPRPNALPPLPSTPPIAKVHNSSLVLQSAAYNSSHKLKSAKAQLDTVAKLSNLKHTKPKPSQYFLNSKGNTNSSSSNYPTNNAFNSHQYSKHSFPFSSTT